MNDSPASVVTHARIPKALHSKLLRLAREDGRTLSNYVARILEQHVTEKAGQ